MSTPVQLYIDRLLRRVRDPDNVGLTREFVRDVIQQSQRLLNARTKVLKASVSMTTFPFQQFYPLSSYITTAIRVEKVRDGDRDLREVTLNQLCQYDTKWHRRVGPSFEVWAPAGRDMIVVHPAKEIQDSVTVVQTTLTALTPLDELTEMELQDDDMVAVMDIAELLTLIKQRRYESLKPLMEQLKGRFGAKENV